MIMTKHDTAAHDGQHTAGRLVAYGLVLRGHPDDPGDESQVAAATTEWEARRLAACWNACEGLTTEALEKLPVPFDTLLSDQFKESLEHGNKMQAEIDVMRALLRKSLPHINPHAVDAAAAMNGPAADAFINTMVRRFLEGGAA